MKQQGLFTVSGTLPMTSKFDHSPVMMKAVDSFFTGWLGRRSEKQFACCLRQLQKAQFEALLPTVIVTMGNSGLVLHTCHAHCQHKLCPLPGAQQTSSEANTPQPAG
jgi:hypothetical protein